MVLPSGIPSKGAVLTQLSAFWFDSMKDRMPSHFISTNWEAIATRHPELAPYAEQFAGRSMLVERTEVIPIECVVRGYLAGSGWKEYRTIQSVCGVSLPEGLRESDRLPEPIFTPATKEESGHDLNITEEEMAQRISPELTQQLTGQGMPPS